MTDPFTPHIFTPVCAKFRAIASRLHTTISREPHAYLFIFLIIISTLALSFTCAQFIVWEQGNLLYPTVWLVCFFLLSLDLVGNIVCAIYYRLTKPYILQEVSLAECPRTAIVYPVRNEHIGLYERISYSLHNNMLPNTDFFFLSDSSIEFVEQEVALIKKIRKDFGHDRIYYIHRMKPTHAKPGNIANWLSLHHHNYDYFFVCDADSILPKDVLKRLLQKAEHPDNNDVSIFQTRMRVAHAKTLFSKHQSLGVDISQKLYSDVRQRIFKSSPSFGHGNLIRMKSFIKISVPLYALSHDIWDMALLNQQGYRTVLCTDVVSYEEAPNNYIENRIRDKRWIKGNLQTIPLLHMPDLSVGARFYIFYGLYVYLIQPVFLIWLFLTLFGNSTLFGQYIYFKPLVHTGAVSFYIELSSFTIGIISALYAHKFIICSRVNDIVLVFKDIIASTLISLNNIVYQTIDITVLCFRGIEWNPMKKDPFSKITFIAVAKALWPSTLIGFYMAYIILMCMPQARLLALPLVISLSTSVPVVYLTSLPLIKREETS